MLRQLLILVSLFILIFGAIWLFMVLGEPEVVTVTRTEYTTQYVPQIIRIEDTDRIEELERELARVKAELQQTRNQRDYYQYERFYERDSDDEYDLDVRVRDEDGEPIENARVRVENGDTEVEYTDEDGEARFNNLEEDCYDIRVSADGYDTEYDDICLDDDERITIRLDS